MHAATAAGQRRPRLMRASVTEPSLFTSSANDHAHLSMAHSSQTCSSSSSAAGRSSSPAGSSSSSSSSSYQRRATDLLNHVAYLSSCATSPVSSLISGTGTTSRSRGALSTMASLNMSSSSSASRSHGATGTGTSSRATAHATSDACYHRRGGGGDSADEVFGSSPASTHTAASMEDLQARYPGSENYYSFPSFDTWDPDCEKEDDIDG